MWRGLVLTFACLTLHAQDGWFRASSPHFEVYSQENEKAATAAIGWLEELRGFVARETGLNPDAADVVRVIAFRSAREYSAYRVQSLADAYYLGSANRHYIVVPSLDGPSFGMTAHEYGHFLCDVAGLTLPRWLHEGMAEVLSSVRVTARGSQIGGDVPERAAALRRVGWMPLEKLLAWPDASHDEDRDEVAMYYAQSWALTEMLALDPVYRSVFRTLAAAIGAGTPSVQALTRVTGKTLNRIAGDLRNRAGHRTVVPFGGIGGAGAVPKLAQVSWFEVRLMLAEVLMLAKEFDRADALYRVLDGESPGRADVAAGLGTVAFGAGDEAGARKMWKRAIDLGITDADLCYRYAILMDAAGASPDESRTVLELVIHLRPGFEDARFRLALLEENAGRHEAALAQLDAIGTPARSRAYHYWTAKAQALIGLSRNNEAEAAGQQAVAVAATTEDRVHALQFVRMARTHPAVQFTRDGEGRLTLSTTRAPNDAADWNAFVEPDDDLRRAEGTLREIECGDAGLRLLIDGAGGRVAVAIPDPAHVQMKNAPAEFFCGTQPPRTVVVDYAASKGKGDGIARGIEFRK